MRGNRPSNRYEYSDSAVNKTASVGSSMSVKCKRGTGTRDQDSFEIKAKGETVEETLAEFETLLDAYETEFADRVRSVQPSDDDE